MAKSIYYNKMEILWIELYTIFNCISLNEKVWIWIKISLKFEPKGPINNSPVSLGLNELIMHLFPPSQINCGVCPQ